MAISSGHLFPSMIDQLLCDSQAILQTFDSVSRTLKASSVIGSSHHLSKKWDNLRTHFTNLHLQSQRNANRLAACLAAHRQNLNLILEGDSLRDVKVAVLSSFRRDVEAGAEEASKLSSEYRGLAQNVHDFPAEIRHSLRGWRMIFTKIKQMCLKASEAIKHLTQFVNNAVAAEVRMLRITVVKSIDSPYSAEPLFTDNMMPPGLHQVYELKLGSGNPRIVRTASSTSKQSTTTQYLSLLEVEEKTQADCEAICDKLEGFSKFWFNLVLSCDDLNAVLRRSEGMIGALRLQSRIQKDIEQFYVPVIEALRAFAASRLSEPFDAKPLVSPRFQQRALKEKI